MSSALESLLDVRVNMGILSQNDSTKLFNSHTLTPIFHSLPKLNKSIFPPPLRPIVAGIGSMGEKLGSLVDAYLQPLVPISPAYLRDTKHVVTLLDGQPWSDTSYWLSCDVTALYRSIPQDLSIQVLGEYMDMYSSYSQETKEFVLLAVEILLKHNFSLFDGSFFLQISGGIYGGGEILPLFSKHLYGHVGTESHLLRRQSVCPPHQVVWQVYR